MCVCMHVCVHSSVCVCACMCVSASGGCGCILVHVCVCAHACWCVCVLRCLCISARVCVCVFVHSNCVCVCMHVHLYVCVYSLSPTFMSGQMIDLTDRTGTIGTRDPQSLKPQALHTQTHVYTVPTLLLQENNNP